MLPALKVTSYTIHNNKTADQHVSFDLKYTGTTPDNANLLAKLPAIAKAINNSSSIAADPVAAHYKLEDGVIMHRGSDGKNWYPVTGTAVVEGAKIVAAATNSNDAKNTYFATTAQDALANDAVVTATAAQNDALFNTDAAKYDGKVGTPSINGLKHAIKAVLNNTFT